MATWEETKRASQTAFINQESNIQAAHESVDRFYRQILSTGHIYPSMSAESLTRQIAEDHFRELEHSQEELSYTRHFDNHEPEQEQDIEPER